MDLRPVRRPLVRSLALSLFACTAFGCGGERYIVVATARAPSSSGYFVLTSESKTATRVKVHMAQLHPVGSLDPSLHAYVVWFESGKAPPVRAGSLHYLPDDRVGELEAVSPFRKFIVKITAEANDKPATEGSYVIASQAVSADD